MAAVPLAPPEAQTFVPRTLGIWLLLLPLPILQLSVTIPKLQWLYDDPRVVWPLRGVMMLAAVACLLWAGRAIASARGPGAAARALWLAGIAAGAGIQAYLILKSNPSPAGSAREIIHIGEYGILGVVVTSLLRPHLRGPLGYVVILSYGSAIGLLDEIVQHFHPMRRGDMRDVATDAASFGLGVAFAAGVRGATLAAGGRRRERQWCALAVGLALSLGLAFQALAHHGYLVADQATGSFRSRLTQQDLLARAGTGDVARYRRVQERDTARPVYALRDFYLTETRDHVIHRGPKTATVAALLENEILEKYYGPALDAIDQRWDPADVAKLGAEVRRLGGRPRIAAREYTSPVLPWLRTRFPPPRILSIAWIPLAAGIALFAVIR